MKDVREHGRSVARHLRGDLYEVRADGAGQSYRLLFAAEGRFAQILLSLHAFSKKTQKTPKKELQLAEERLREWRARK